MAVSLFSLTLCWRVTHPPHWHRKAPESPGSGLDPGRLPLTPGEESCRDEASARLSNAMKVSPSFPKPCLSPILEEAPNDMVPEGAPRVSPVPALLPQHARVCSLAPTQASRSAGSWPVLIAAAPPGEPASSPSPLRYLFL